jgi:photosystem II stability/assembly factor-like uncharacterized protein
MSIQVDATQEMASGKWQGQVRPITGRRCCRTVVALLLWLPLMTVAADIPALPAPAVHQLLLDVARAGSRLVAVGERGRILFSTDQGQTWQPATTPGEATLTAVYFHDDLHGWAVGHDAVILRTEDGGVNWSLVHQAPSERKPLLDVWFENADHGFAVGAYGLFLETRDGGRRWQARRALNDDLHLNAIVGAPGGRIYLAGEAGTLLRSDDSGRRWHKLASPYRGSFFGILRLPDGNPLIFGMRGKAFRSPDGGRRWVPVTSHSEATLQGGALLADGAVVLVGNDGTVLVSRDQGRHFSRHRHDVHHAFAAVTSTASTLVVVGERGFTLLPWAEAGR